MPIYDYVCDKCGSREDVFASVAEYTRTGTEQKCSVCGATMRRGFRPCSIQTDDTFFAGVGTLLDQCGGNEAEANRIVAAARRNGYNPSPNDFYCATLAQKPGDPNAFISQGGGRSQVRKVCEREGISCEGMVNVKSSQRPPKKKTRLAERLVREHMKREITRDPSLMHDAKRRSMVREAVVERHSFRKAGEV